MGPPKFTHTHDGLKLARVQIRNNTCNLTHPSLKCALYASGVTACTDEGCRSGASYIFITKAQIPAYAHYRMELI